MKWIYILTLVFMVCAAGGCGRASRSEAGREASLVDVNRAVAVYRMVNGSYPASVSDLTNSPILRGKTLPVPPAGEKLAIDINTHRVVFINQ